MKGKLVTLRAMDRNDLLHVHQMFCDPDVIRTAGYTNPISQVEVERLFAKCWSEHGDKGYYFTIVAPNGHFAGIAWIVNVDRLNGHAEIRVIVADRDDWHHGYGQDAAHVLCEFGFAQARLERLYANCLTVNRRAIRGCMNIGFQREGTLRSAFVMDGERLDVAVMGMLRGELKRVA